MTQPTITKLETLDHSENYGGVDFIINDTRKKFSGSVRGEVKVSICSVRGYALYNKDDPAESIARSVKLGHELVWISLHAGVITNSPGYYEREAAKWANALVVTLGDKVEFEGNVYEIYGTANNNFGLKLVAVATDEEITNKVIAGFKNAVGAEFFVGNKNGDARLVPFQFDDVTEATGLAVALAASYPLWTEVFVRRVTVKSTEK